MKLFKVSWNDEYGCEEGYYYKVVGNKVTEKSIEDKLKRFKNIFVSEVTEIDGYEIIVGKKKGE